MTVRQQVTCAIRRLCIGDTRSVCGVIISRKAHNIYYVGNRRLIEHINTAYFEETNRAAIAKVQNRAIAEAIRQAGQFTARSA